MLPIVKNRWSFLVSWAFTHALVVGLTLLALSGPAVRSAFAADDTAKPPGASTRKDPKNHWAFRAPVRPSLPHPNDKKWLRTPVDNFVLARLDREGLKPS